jgi:chromosome segregation protein
VRIERLHLERYGAFTGRVLDFEPHACLHVVLGANEAGKTSTLQAIGDLLFGFERRTSYDFQHEQKSLRVGAEIRLADGAVFSIRRRKGDKNTLLDAEDKPLADDPLVPLLGSLTRETFFAEFGLTSSALRAGGLDLLKAGGRLAETLAASSAQLSTLMRLRGRLDQEADSLFGPRRSAGKAFYVALDRHEQAEKRLRDAIVTADSYAAAERAVAEAEAQRKTLDSQHHELSRDLHRRERARRVWKKLDQLRRLREELAQLADLPPVAREAVKEWRDALQLRATIEDDLARQQVEEMEAAEEIAALEIDAPLIETATEIDALRERLGEIRKAENDLPRRREASRLAREQLDELARRLGLADADALIARQPSDATISGAEAAMEARNDAEKRLAAEQEKTAEAERRLQELEQSQTPGEALVDPAPFRQRIAAFVDLPGEADRARRERLAFDHAEAELLRETQRLDPSPGTPEALARLPLPEGAQIEEFRRRFETLKEAEQREAQELERLAISLAQIEEELRVLSRAGEVSTRNQLSAARRERDAAMTRLSQQLVDVSSRREAFEKLEAANRKVDAITNALLDDGARVARYANAVERREKLQQERLSHELARQGYETGRQEASLDWRRLWSASGLEPRSPALMAQWIDDTREILQKRRHSQEARLELAALSQKIEENRAALTALVEALGETVDPALPTDALHRQARAALERLETGWNAAQGASARLESARSELARARRQQDVAQLKLESAHADWPEAIAPLGLRENASLPEVKAALAVWRAVPAPRLALLSEQHRVETMEADIASFEAAVDQLVAKAAPDLKGMAQRDALTALGKRLEESKEALTKRSTLEEKRQRREEARVKLLRRAEGASKTLSSAYGALGVANPTALRATLERFDHRFGCEAALSAARRDLAESGDGLDEAALREEQAGFDFDALPGEIERAGIAVKNMIDDIALAETRVHETRRARDALAQGRDAAAAAAEKAEAAADVLEVSRRWLRRAAAAKLASLAIERHRQTTADPLIARASELFAAATDGAFQTLGVDYDEADAPMLVGLREGGQRVPVAGMSEGTRDQLFLALRLALLELRKAEPLPFIGDDLLASFDEERTRRALELIAQFGRERQAILFTHHRHVPDIAAQITDARIDIVRL